MNLDISDWIKPSPINIIIIGLSAVIFITLAKYVFARVNVPGVSTLIAAV